MLENARQVPSSLENNHRACETSRASRFPTAEFKIKAHVYNVAAPNAEFSLKRKVYAIVGQ